MRIKRNLKSTALPRIETIVAEGLPDCEDERFDADKILEIKLGEDRCMLIDLRKETEGEKYSLAIVFDGNIQLSYDPVINDSLDSYGCGFGNTAYTYIFVVPNEQLGISKSLSMTVCGRSVTLSYGEQDR